MISKSENETKEIAAEFAKMVRQAHHKSKIFALTGKLGTGKTTFAQGFAKGLGIKDKIISPTFVLIRQHQIPQSKRTLFHIDLYRLGNNLATHELGLEEIWSNKQNIILIEWAEKIRNLLPKNTTWISFETTAENHRQINLY